MNIFYVDKDPAKAAIALHDRHIIKMISESCQLLSVWASRYTGPHDDETHQFVETDLVPDKAPDVPWTGLSHANHPAALWLNEGLGNVSWLVDHLRAMVNEYDYRYPGNPDKFERARVIVPAMKYWLSKFVILNHTTPKACVPDVYKRDPMDRENTMQAYRAYYLAEKINGNNWTNRAQPDWVIAYKEVKKAVAATVDYSDLDMSFFTPKEPVRQPEPVAQKQPVSAKVSAKDIFL